MSQTIHKWASATSETDAIDCCDSAGHRRDLIVDVVRLANVWHHSGASHEGVPRRLVQAMSGVRSICFEAFAHAYDLVLCVTKGRVERERACVVGANL